VLYIHTYTHREAHTCFFSLSPVISSASFVHSCDRYRNHSRCHICERIIPPRSFLNNTIIACSLVCFTNKQARWTRVALTGVSPRVSRRVSGYPPPVALAVMGELEREFLRLWVLNSESYHVHTGKLTLGYGRIRIFHVEFSLQLPLCSPTFSNKSWEGDLQGGEWGLRLTSHSLEVKCTLSRRLCQSV